MGYIPYPERPQTPNALQTIGGAMVQGGNLFDDANERQFKMRQAMEEMTQKRAAAILAQQEAELRAKQLEQDTRLKAEADQRAHDFAIEAAKGKVISPTLAKDPSLARRTMPAPSTAPMVPGGPSAADLADLSNVQGLNLPSQSVKSGGDATAMMGAALDNQPDDPSAGRVPYDRKGLVDLALQTRQIDAKDYMAATKPEKEHYSVQEVGGRKVRINMDTGEQDDLGPAKPTRDRFVVNEIGGHKVRVNLDTGETLDLGPITSKPMSPKDQATAKSKITMLTLAKQQLDQVQSKFDAIKNTMSAGPLGQGKAPTPSGKAFDAAVAAMRNTITGLTRVPGVGSMSDFETKLSQAGNPSRTEYEDVTQQQIDQMYQMINTLSTGYQGMLPGIDDTPDAGGAPSPAPNSAGAPAPRATGPSLPARGRFKALDAPTAADYLKRAGGDRKKAKTMLAKDGYNVGG
jgi:hypothetical protein